MPLAPRCSRKWPSSTSALLADGWHMSSHALALGRSVLAYAAARRFAKDGRFAFGTWKIEILGGYTSALVLVGVAVLMLYQSVERLLSPMPIHYEQAISMAAVGLVVNLACAWLLRDGHGHHHRDHEHHDHDEPAHHDLNLRSAYLHVIADAATSVLAIVALLGGMRLGVNWLDPLMGIVGAILVSVWVYGLLRDTGGVLLDAEMDAPVVKEIREVVAEAPVEAEIADLHVWCVGRGKYASILSLVTHSDAQPEDYRRRLAVHEELVYVTVEVNRVAAESSA